jgi:cytochrome c nitrite reductase small subunit
MSFRCQGPRGPCRVGVPEVQRSRSRWAGYWLEQGYGAPVVALAVTVGLVMGAGAYTFLYAKGLSYLSSDPAACANCHVMRGHYDAWLKGSHRQAAVCNDCHTPAGFLGKWSTKALNGFWHSYAFTTGDYPDPIRIKERNRKVAEQACRKCHADIVQAIEGTQGADQAPSCIRCHAGVGHMELN